MMNQLPPRHRRPVHRRHPKDRRAARISLDEKPLRRFLHVPHERES